MVSEPPSTDDLDPSDILRALGVDDDALPPEPPQSGGSELEAIAVAETDEDQSSTVIQEQQIGELVVSTIGQESPAETPIIGDGMTYPKIPPTIETAELRRTQIAGDVLEQFRRGRWQEAFQQLIMIDDPTVLTLVRTQLQEAVRAKGHKVLSKVDPEDVSIFEGPKLVLDQAVGQVNHECRALMMDIIESAEAILLIFEVRDPLARAVCATRIRSPQLRTAVLLDVVTERLQQMRKRISSDGFEFSQSEYDEIKSIVRSMPLSEIDKEEIFFILRYRANNRGKIERTSSLGELLGYDRADNVVYHFMDDQQADSMKALDLPKPEKVVEE